MPIKPLLAILLTVSSFFAFAPRQVVAEPMAEKYLLEGKLKEGEQACLAHLADHPDDDEARFGLGAIQFLLTFEHFGTTLHEHGLLTNRGFPGLSRDLRRLLPPNPDPKQVAYKDIRAAIQRALDDLAKTEATLALVDDPNVKLPLHAAMMTIDLFGLEKPISARFVLGQVDLNLPAEALEGFVITFDRGDVDWLRGYCHFLSAVGELALAVDAEELFECTAHVFFKRVDSPHKFFQEEQVAEGEWGWLSRPMISDAIAFIHLLRFPIKEPARMKASLAHLEATIHHSRQMWVHYQKETDDDNEWIPNPNQRGAMRIKVSQKMVDSWLKTVDESEAVLKGEKLLPFWRGNNPKRGVNLRRVFTEPRIIDPILWIQGSAATPYLEDGPITELANPRMLRELSQTFGGLNFIGFAFWFN